MGPVGHEAVELLGVVWPMLAQLESVSLTATRVVRDSGVWGLDGSRSARAFLERATGASGARTGSDLKLAERLATLLPLTAQALRAGAVSGWSTPWCCPAARAAALRASRPWQTRCGARGRCLVHAGLGVDQFKQVVARWAYRVDPDADDAKRRAAADDFHFDLAETMDGVHLRGFATPEVGEALSTALAAVIGTPAGNDGRSPSRRRHDALATLAQLALSSGGLGTLGAVRPQLVVHVDWRTLIGLPGLTGLDPAVLQEVEDADPAVGPRPDRV